MFASPNHTCCTVNGIRYTVQNRTFYLGRVEGAQQPDLAERRHGRGRRQRRRGGAQVVFHGRGRVLLLVLFEPALELLVDERVRVRRVPVLGLVPSAGQRRAARCRVHGVAVGLPGERRHGCCESRARTSCRRRRRFRRPGSSVTALE